jgi:UDP-N-acetylmuramoyl-L-alanyl-D-glutamate--2,6-diaminopimelate ligase
MFQKLKNYLWHLPTAIFWNVYYGFPHRHLTLIGITGTDGKTTTCTLIQSVLTHAGIKTGIISTINSPGLHTTCPEPKILMQMFQKYIQDGYTHVVCEVTSHALDQFRFWGCHFSVAALTNISHEHLDYHQNIKNYLLTKSKIFRQSQMAILNADDPYFSDIKKQVFGKVKSYGVKNKSNLQAKSVRVTDESLDFLLDGQKYSTDSNFYYQIYNILAAIAVCDKLGIDRKILSQTIEHFPETKGRREIIKNDLHLHCFVDFAHTPNALFETLSSLKNIYQGKLICLFGATGGRDKSKRPIMGEVVSKIADIAIITADDTRNESIDSINQQIISGIDPKRVKQKKFQYYNIVNRQDAFNFAVKTARPGDTVIACGKGHETTILHGKTEYPWSETEAFNTAFRNLDQNV